MELVSQTAFISKFELYLASLLPKHHIFHDKCRTYAPSVQYSVELKCAHLHWQLLGKKKNCMRNTEILQ